MYIYKCILFLEPSKMLFTCFLLTLHHVQNCNCPVRHLCFAITNSKLWYKVIFIIDNCAMTHFLLQM